MLPRFKSVLSASLLLAFAACGKQNAATTPPETDIAAIQAEPEPEATPEPEPPQRRVGEDAVAVGTFNLQWAHDALGDGPKLALQYRARSDEDWEWKVEHIARLLVQEKLDVVALQELGGDGEVTDIVLKVAELGGPDYDWAFVESTDKMAGHNVAILSRFPISHQRRFDIHMRRHLAADIELPNDYTVTFVAIHAAGGKYASNEKRRTKQAKALKRKLVALQKEHPVVVLGTANSPHLPGGKSYRTSSIGTLTGRTTRQSADDCLDSAEFISGQATNVRGDTADRILSCGLAMTDVEMSGHAEIIRSEPDPDDLVWSEIPIEESPYRDLSDHLVLWAELAIPKAPEPEPELAGDTATAAP